MWKEKNYTFSVRSVCSREKWSFLFYTCQILRDIKAVPRRKYLALLHTSRNQKGQNRSKLSMHIKNTKNSRRANVIKQRQRKYYNNGRNL